jgi:hypothetical protein
MLFKATRHALQATTAAHCLKMLLALATVQGLSRGLTWIVEIWIGALQVAQHHEPCLALTGVRVTEECNSIFSGLDVTWSVDAHQLLGNEGVIMLSLNGAKARI